MDNLPLSISLLFVVTTLLTVAFFYKASNYSLPTLLILITWLILQGIVATTDFYLVTDSFPPRFLLLVLPPLLLIIGLFITKKGRHYLDGLDGKTLTLLHCVRVPVELVLYWLFLQKAVPELMTFEGRNFDILSGISAPLIYYFVYMKKKINTNILLIWNLICLALLINIVVHAVLSAPFPFQQLAFDQPNIAVLYFPFNWLPACVVPLVLLSHLASIRKLMIKKDNPVQY